MQSLRGDDEPYKDLRLGVAQPSEAEAQASSVLAAQPSNLLFSKH